MDGIILISFLIAVYLIEATLSWLLSFFFPPKKPCLPPAYANKKVLSDRIEYYDEEGRLHRLDGPAIEFKSGFCVYYVYGRIKTKKEFYNKWMRSIK
jgi:hypothetical protein